MKHIHTFENFLNESAGNQLAGKYDCSPLSDLEDWDEDSSDECIKWKNDTVKGGKLGTRNEDEIYAANKNYLEGDGNWDKLLTELKRTNTKHEIFSDDDDDYVLFSNK